MSDVGILSIHSSLSLESASKIVDAALTAGRHAKLYPLTVAVLDAGGHLVAMKREDGSGIVRLDVAVAKAWGALGMGMASRTLRNRMAERVGFQASLSAASGGRFAAAPGGVLIVDTGGTVIGAVGISGDASDKDEYCAIVGVKAAGLTPEPSEPAPNWPSAPL